MSKELDELTRRVGSGGKSALNSLDLGLDYLRLRWVDVAVPYVIGHIPTTMAVFQVADAVSVKSYTSLSFWLFILSVTLLWRWTWLAIMQRQVQRDLQGEMPAVSLFGRLPAIFLCRAVGNFLLTWLNFFLITVPVGFAMGSLTTPALLESTGTVASRLGEAARVIGQSWGLVSRLLLILFHAFLFVYGGVLILQWIMTTQIMQSVFGLPVEDLKITFLSTTWNVLVFYFIALVFDFYWQVVAVFLYFQVEARRRGGDLTRRVQQLGGVVRG